MNDTKVNVRCDCGDKEKRPEAVTLRLCTTNQALSYYSFLCTACGVVRKPASQPVIAILTYYGAKVLPWTVPAEALERHHGMALTLDALTESPFAWDALLAGAA